MRVIGRREFLKELFDQFMKHLGRRPKLSEARQAIRPGNTIRFPVTPFLGIKSKKAQGGE